MAYRFFKSWGMQKPPLGTQINRNHSLGQALLACWLMNENGGTKIFDISGNGHTGVFSLGQSGSLPAWGRGLTGPSTNYILGSFGGYIETNYVLPTTNFSVSCWANSNHPSASFGDIVLGNADIAAGLSGFGMIWGYNATDKFFLIARQGANVSTFDIDVLVPNPDSFDGNWHHVVATISSVNGMSFYYDGQFVANNPLTTSITSSLTFRIGAGGNDDQTFTFDGGIDNVQIFNGALSATQIQQLFIQPFGFMMPPRLSLISTASAPPPPVSSIYVGSFF